MPMRPSPLALRQVCALLSTVLLATLLVTVGAPPMARDLERTSGWTYLCSGYAGCRESGYSDGGYGKVNHRMYWNMYSGHNCTNYVAYRMIQDGVSSSRPFGYPGNATHWGQHRSDITDQRPRVGAVAWWKAYDNGSGSSGHVAYVERVQDNGNTIVISEDNWGGTFHWRRISKSSGRWPTGFIHFKQRKIQNTVRPQVRGTLRVGQRLRGTTGRWKPGGAKTFQWFANGRRLAGETDQHLRLTPAHLGKRISHRVITTRNGWDSGRKWSPRSQRVRPGVFEVTQRPVVTGTPVVGQTLSLDAGAVSPQAANQQIEWRADGKPIADASDRELTLTADQVGARITARVVVAAEGYRDRAMFSAPTAAVDRGVFEVAQRPVVSGEPTVGQTVSVDPGVVSPDAEGRRVEWRADGKLIEVAADPTLTLAAAHAGARITARIVVSRPGYRNRAMTSAPTDRVQLGELAVTQRPKVSGTPAVGHVLTAEPGTFSPPQDKRRIQWLADGKPIPGASGASLRLTGDQAGRRIAARVVASKAGYRDQVALSAPSGWVRDGVIEIKESASIAGRLAVGSTLQAAPGATNPASGVRTRYQWLRDGQVIAGKTARRYRLTPSDFGRRIGVRVTYRHPKYFDAREVDRTHRRIRVTPEITTRTNATGQDGRTVVVRPTVSHAAADVVRGKVTVRVAGQARSRWLRDGQTRVVFRGVPYGSRQVTVRFHHNNQFLWAVDRERVSVTRR